MQQLLEANKSSESQALARLLEEFSFLKFYNMGNINENLRVLNTRFEGLINHQIYNKDIEEFPSLFDENDVLIVFDEQDFYKYITAENKATAVLFTNNLNQRVEIYGNNLKIKAVNAASNLEFFFDSLKQILINRSPVSFL